MLKTSKFRPVLWLKKKKKNFSGNLASGDSNYSFLYNGTIHALESTKEERDLGVLIDNQLSFNSHVFSKVTKTSQMTRIIRNSFTSLDHITFPQSFKSLVRPHIEYASCVWSLSVKYLSPKIEGGQRRAGKLPIAMTSWSYEERLHRLNLSSLKCRRRRTDLFNLQCYNIMNNLDTVK